MLNPSSLKNSDLMMICYHIDDDMLSYLCENIFTLRIIQNYIKKNRTIMNADILGMPNVTVNQIVILEDIWFNESGLDNGYITYAKQKYNRKKILKYLLYATIR